MRSCMVLPAALAISLMSPCASAQTPSAGSSEGWGFSVTPYVWFAGISGDATLRDRTASGSADFGNVLDDLDFAFMTSAEVRYGRFGVLADFLYMDLSQGVSTPRDLAFRGGTGTVTATGLGFAAMFRVIEDPRGSLDVGAGIRPWWVDTRLRLNPGLVPGRTFSTSANWTDPIIALRGHIRLSEQFSLTAYGDIGGFGVGSDFTWQAMGTLNWQPHNWLVLSAGWRHLAFDFENGETSLDMAISGPILGASFRF